MQSKSNLYRQVHSTKVSQVLLPLRLALLLQAVVLGLMMRGMDDASCKVYAVIGMFLYAYFFLAFLSPLRLLLLLLLLLLVMLLCL